MNILKPSAARIRFATADWTFDWTVYLSFQKNMQKGTIFLSIQTIVYFIFYFCGYFTNIYIFRYYIYNNNKTDNHIMKYFCILSNTINRHTDFISLPFTPAILHSYCILKRTFCWTQMDMITEPSMPLGKHFFCAEASKNPAAPLQPAVTMQKRGKR